MKKIFSILAVAVVALVFTSCGMEGKYKSFYETEGDITIEMLKLSIEKAENDLARVEWLNGLDDEELEEYLDKNDDWEEDVEKDYEEDVDELKDELEKINKQISKEGKKLSKRLTKIED